jgi:predicted RNase H-like nuclease (RuvC/YqgF family)
LINSQTSDFSSKFSSLETQISDNNNYLTQFTDNNKGTTLIDENSINEKLQTIHETQKLHDDHQQTTSTQNENILAKIQSLETKLDQQKAENEILISKLEEKIDLAKLDEKISSKIAEESKNLEKLAQNLHLNLNKLENNLETKIEAMIKDPESSDGDSVIEF